MEGAKSLTFLQKGVVIMTIPTVNFMSYNSTGMSSDKVGFINQLCDENEIMFVSIQEHFKKNKQTDKYFRSKFDLIPGYRPSGQDSGSRKCLDIRKDRVKTSNFRIQFKHRF